MSATPPFADCWASTLGNCGGGRSGEHIVSDGIFDQEVITAQGLPWCKDRPIKIGLARAVAKILCEHHNNALSPFDAEAAKLSRFLTAGLREAPLADHQVRLSGKLLEKWALKTLLNLGYVGALTPKAGHVRRLKPPVGVVRYLFEDTQVPEGIGLYFVSGLSIFTKDYATGLSWSSMRSLDDPKQIIGMTFTFNGVRFVVSLVPDRPEKLGAVMRAVGVVNGVDYSRASYKYRPATIVLTSETAGRKVINLGW